MLRLIWWEWNWDAVEPFTFVFMYSLLIAGFAYFVLTKKDLTYQGARLKAKKMLLHRWICWFFIDIFFCHRFAYFL